MLCWKLSGWLTKQSRRWLASITAFTFEVVILSSLQCCRNQKISICLYLPEKKKYLLWRDVYLGLPRCNHSSTGTHLLINIYLLLNSKPRADNSVVLTQGVMSSSEPGANNSDVVTQLSLYSLPQFCNSLLRIRSFIFRCSDDFGIYILWPFGYYASSFVMLWTVLNLGNCNMFIRWYHIGNF